MFPPFIDEDAKLLHPLDAMIEPSTEEVEAMLEFATCNMPGVGIIVPTREDLTVWEFGWF